MNVSDLSIGFIGGGQMAEALIRGLLAARLAPADQLAVLEPDENRCRHLESEYSIHSTRDAKELCRRSRVLVAAVKPQLADQALGACNPFVSDDHLVVSIMAGVSLADLADIFTEPVRLIRVMPNTPALVLAGASAFSANDRATAEDRQVTEALFSAVGTCVEVAEHQLDAVTGLSGSGPGYVFTFIEALIDGGVLAGLPRPLAEQLVLQTVYGSARLALETSEHPAVLKGRVTSPGGTTITGLQVLEQGAFRGLVMNAVAAATTRSRELGA
jgi:pyrroline-5-carboxylate reductase